MATNSMTMHAAVPIIQTAKALNLLTISSEVLRCHSKRPGLLSDSVYDKYHSTTIKTTVEKKVVDVTITDDSTPPASEAIRKLSREVEETAKEFHVALDRCLQAEKIFLNNFRDSMPSIPVTDFCLAHVLGNSYKQFLYPEEWSYMVRQKVSASLLAYRI